MRDYFDINIVKRDENGDYIIELEHTKPDQCPYCSSKNFTRNAIFNHKRRDYNNSEGGTIITKGDRYRCRDCGKTFSPVDNSDSKLYTDSLIENFVYQFIYSNKSWKELEKEFGINKNTGVNLIRNFFNQKRKDYQYLLPRVLGVVPVQIGKGERLLLYNILALELIDIITVDRLKDKLKENEVKEVVFLNNNDYKKYGEGIDKASILNDVSEKAALEALAKDAEMLDSKSNISTYIKKGDSPDIWAGNPELFSVELAFRAIREKGIAEMIKNNFRTPLKYLSEFLRNIDTNDLKVTDLRKDLKKAYLKLINEAKNRIENPKRKKLSEDRIIGAELYLQKNEN